MTKVRPRVLVIGGSGVFGSHVCRRLARLGLYRIAVGGRDEVRANGLLAELQAVDSNCEATFVPLDRNGITSGDLEKIGIIALVDAAGPFQGSSYQLVEAAIAARVHYIDLSDARDFVRGITQFDTAAKAASVFVLTGASSTPAISSALIRDAIDNWQSVDHLSVAIVPGNDAPRGRSVMQAILSWVGEPVRVFDGGRWQIQRGWSGSSKVSLGRHGMRSAALADTADLDILVNDFHPRVSARFSAGLELSVMHIGLRFAGWLRRWRLLPRLDRLTRLFHTFAKPLAKFGTNVGGMVIQADGTNENGAVISRSVRLIAEKGHGPIIPALASVALLKRLADGRLTFTGADHAGHHLESQDFMSLTGDLAIRLEQEDRPMAAPLFHRVLGYHDFSCLPQVTQEIHRGVPAVKGSGYADIEPAERIIGRWIANLFQFPKPGASVPLDVIIEQTEDSERWVRYFPGRTMVSRMRLVDADRHLLEEQFGPFSFAMHIASHAFGLDMHMISGRLGFVPLPQFLLPIISASERVNDARHHEFDVSISLPVVGKLVRYRGWLSQSQLG